MPTYNIAYTIDYRGDSGNQLTFVFRGVPLPIVERVFMWLGRGSYFFDGVVVDTELDCISHNGYSHQRITAKIKGMNTNTISVENLAELTEARFKAETKCHVSRMTMNRFLNV